MKYLKFKFNNSEKVKTETGFLGKTLIKLLHFFTPTANPDFENSIDNVIFWLIEFDEKGVPTREIGLDVDSSPILKMPYKKNYGFWTDNDLLYTDFISRFSALEIDEKIFNIAWNDFK
ncbi:hypothetical protein HZP56_08360 [Elizabethkingia anophelis]|uniref:hypothetical protein n=1 Tax=Elizabethkingia anophelis TaxID=1117645 RepID=UPI000389F72C|nr:hypothetical protein [Elizabethkingia anophelis]EQB90594.1 hypothetical protein C874_14855 [Elizabethkingia anophelis 502]MCT3833550.1 hypothetical protein [Elizabethkingia anophelis]MCT3976919.1 hypothetical protein [Elizabethkingia anophelis]MCT4040501.1 hypothetical protein [Elizabethkingia anophelis]MCT4135684.1 hypothetical protein [Elizabethkingia anophelis]